MKFYFLLLFWIVSGLSAGAQECSRPFRMVILGSSTAYGTGSKPIKDSSWVNRYTRYLKSINPDYTVINLALGGYDTYRIQPGDFSPPAGRPKPDTARNITQALSLNPDVILINLPSNDASENIPEQDQMDNFERVARLADSAKVLLWVTTTQPRDFPPQKVLLQTDMRDWIKIRFKDKSIDFWTGLDNPSGTQDTLYGAGDGIHLNNAGHRILYERVVLKDIPDTLCHLPIRTAALN